MLANPYVRISNNFAHDMATGTWAACVLVLWVLARQAQGVHPDAVSAIGDAGGVVFVLLLAALALVTLTGVLRLFYWRSTTPAEELSAKRRALIVKHIAFLVVYGGGTWWAQTLLV
jgi:hypothetical protein